MGRAQEGVIWGRVKLMGDKEVEGSRDKEDVGKKPVSEWKCVGEGSREIAPTQVTPPHTLFPARPKPVCCSNNPLPFTPPPNTPSALPPPPFLFVSLLLFFRSVAHGAEKIVFITCQHLAALSYAMQDSIKLSYTGMKLQNRPGTPQQNYFIFSPQN